MGDCLYGSLVKLSWSLKLSYQTILKHLCCCFKQPLLSNYARGAELDEQGRTLIVRILHTLMELPEGSQVEFYDYFEARVLPRIALEPLMLEEPVIPVTMVYGGERDWVDKTGAGRLAERYSAKIKLSHLPRCGHNIPFHTEDCTALFRSLFQ